MEEGVWRKEEEGTFRVDKGGIVLTGETVGVVADVSEEKECVYLLI